MVKYGMASIDLHSDVETLTAALVDIESVSRNESEIADAVERELSALSHLSVVRDGHTMVARTSLGHDERVVIAGHLDTVPVNDNLPSRRDDVFLHGLGSCDMKGGVAIALRLAATIPEPVRDITYVFYEAEEIAAEFNGLGRLAREHPEWLAGDFAILMEASNAVVEAGCQGTLRVEVVTRGVRSHSARSWMGENAIHAASPILERLVAYESRSPVIGGLTYREGMNAVGVRGGVAGNVVPDEARVTVNYRFAPDRSSEEALAHVRELFDGFEVEVTDLAPGALPGLERPAVSAFVDAVGGEVNPKFGWTDVAQFTELGVPAVNYGPGDPSFAHTREERVPLDHLRLVETRMRDWLS